MTLHPQATAHLAGIEADTPWADPTPDELVASRAANDVTAAAAGGPPTPLPVVRDLDAAGTMARLYDPRAGRGAPVVVYLHGGGWVSGSIVAVDGLCRRIAARSGAAVFSVDYPLAPENPWPAGITGAEAAVAWLRKEAAELGVNTDRMVVAGDSAGGNLATVLARRARDNGTPYAGQLLVYPVISPIAPAARGAEHGLSAAEMDYYWRAYGADPDSPDADPSRAADLAGMPPTLVLTAEYDVLRDEGERYAAQLAAAGVPTTLVRYQGVPHSFARKLALFDAARIAADQLASTAAAFLEG